MAHRSSSNFPFISLTFRRLPLFCTKRYTALKSLRWCKNESQKNYEHHKPRDMLRTLMSVLTKKVDVKIQFIENHVRKLYDESPKELSPTLQNILKMKFQKEITDKASEIINLKPQMLGFTSEQLDNRLDFLNTIGVRGKDAIIISLSIPSSLSMESARFREMVEILKSYDCNIIKHLYESPWVTTLNPELCRKNFNLLEKIGFSKQDIRFLVDAHPTIISFGVDKSLLENVEKMKKFLSDSCIISSDEISLAAKALHMSLTWPGYLCNLDNMNLDVKLFLESLQIPVEDVLVKCPIFFQQDLQKLNNIKDFLTQEPVAYDLQNVCELIKQRPEVYIQLSNSQAQENVIFLSEILSVSGVQKFLVIVKGVSYKNSKTSDCLKCLQKFGFSHLDIENLFCDSKKKTFLFKMKVKTLERKLSCLLNYGDFKPIDVINFHICLNLHPLHLENRLGYKRFQFPESCFITLKELLLSSDKDFVSKLGDLNVLPYRRFIEKGNKTENTEN